MIPMVARVFPEAKFLVALRDPRDVVLSCFMQALPLTPISSAYLSLETAVNAVRQRMGFWLAMRPRLDAGQWVEVRYEDMVDDLPAVARRTLAFLGVEFDPAVLAVPRARPDEAREVPVLRRRCQAGVPHRGRPLAQLREVPRTLPRPARPVPAGVPLRRNRCPHPSCRGTRCPHAGAEWASSRACAAPDLGELVPARSELVEIRGGIRSSPRLRSAPACGRACGPRLSQSVSPTLTRPLLRADPSKSRNSATGRAYWIIVLHSGAR